LVFRTNAVTTIAERSFAGLAVAHFAMMLVVCGGLLLLLPIAASTNGVPAMAGVPALDCAAPANRAGDSQLTDDAAGLDAPDSCDDEDDDDHGDDDSASGSGQAIAASHRIPANHHAVSQLVHVDSDAHRLRPLDAHSLRGPPQNEETSPDADVDGDDDDPSPEHSVVRPAASSCDASLRRAADFLSASSIRFSVLSLRAPPL
jgi:hypothetical protein